MPRSVRRYAFVASILVQACSGGGAAPVHPGGGGGVGGGSPPPGGTGGQPRLDTGVAGEGGAPIVMDAAPAPSKRDAAGPATDGAVPVSGDAGKIGPAPPATWMEHWFEHVQLLKLVDYNDDVALYVDDDVDRKTIDWVLPLATRIWQYTKQTYGDFGPENRLYWILHQGKYSGGHPSTYFDASHDKRNVSDVGPGPWPGPTGFSLDGPSHETGHVVESANNGMHGSPAFGIWMDSKWNEFYQYDLYVGLGLKADADRVLARFSGTADNFPQAGTHWFRDWFFPLWRDHGHAQVMVRFFKLLATNFRKNGTSYAGGLNFGEFVHFMSGAAGVNLKDQATTAFGWPADREAQFNKARTDFPGVTY
jgi:hypothetical protein